MQIENWELRIASGCVGKEVPGPHTSPGLGLGSNHRRRDWLLLSC